MKNCKRSWEFEIDSIFVAWESWLSKRICDTWCVLTLTSCVMLRTYRTCICWGLISLTVLWTLYRNIFIYWPQPWCLKGTSWCLRKAVSKKETRSTSATMCPNIFLQLVEKKIKMQQLSKKSDLEFRQKELLIFQYKVIRCLKLRKRRARKNNRKVR